MAKKFYIKERNNPQFKKPYYIACGQLSVKDAKAAENTAYGYNYMIPYPTREAYDKAIDTLKQHGHSVTACNLQG